MVAQTRAPERVPNRILRFIFQDEANAQKAWKDRDFKSRSDIVKACKDHETLMRMRWKDYPTNTDDLMSEEQIEHFKELPSFFNWMQNNHGTLPDHPVDVVTDNVRTLFMLFVDMDADERETADPSGVVKYDKDIALASEERKKLGAFANPPAASNSGNSGGLTLPSKCRSAAANASAPECIRKPTPTPETKGTHRNTTRINNQQSIHKGVSPVLNPKILLG